MNTKKRRQHYIWKKYLEPWCTNGRVWCLKNGIAKPFNTNPINVGVERDFYKISKLTKSDIDFIQKVMIDPIKNDDLRRLNSGWVTTFQNIFQVNDSLKSSDAILPEHIKMLDSTMHNIDEDYHSRIESSALRYIESLRKGDSSFYNDANCAMKFIYFLSTQYFRTKKIRDNVISILTATAPDGVSIERTWPITRHIVSTSLAFNLYDKRKEFRIIAINNDSDVDFITSDQPIQNIHASCGNNKIPDEVEFYYPISPRISILISKDARYADKTEEHAGQIAAYYYNDIAAKSAHEQIYAKTEKCLGHISFSSKSQHGHI